MVEHMEGTVRRPAYRVVCDNCGASSGYSDRGDHVKMWNSRAALAASQPADPVTNAGCCQPAKVKPLVWVHVAKFCGQEHSYAKTELGTWGLTAYSGREGRWAYTDATGADSEDDWLTRDECQAAAQADYEARILAALEPDQTAPALVASAPNAVQWQPIETAPKDGTRVLLWRGNAPSCGIWAEMVVAEYHHFKWRWPDKADNPSTHGDWSDDEIMDGFEALECFSHWMPLPKPPEGV